MLIIMLAAAALSITAVSRRITAHYSDYVGLFDLAVAGNEQALFLLRQAAQPQYENAYTRAWQRAVDENIIVLEYHNGGLRLQYNSNWRPHDPLCSRRQFERIFAEEGMHDLRPVMRDIFSPVHSDYRLAWGIEASIEAGEFAITDSYGAVTNISAINTNNRINLHTYIHRYNGDTPGVQFQVNASIIWSAAGQRQIILDAYTIAMLILAGVEFPIMPGNGENILLFLDEFALTMVESHRR